MIARMDEIMALSNTSFAQRHPSSLDTGSLRVHPLLHHPALWLAPKTPSTSSCPNFLTQYLTKNNGKILFRLFLNQRSYSPRFRPGQPWIRIISTTHSLATKAHNQFVQKHYSARPDILETFLDLKIPSPPLRSATLPDRRI